MSISIAIVINKNKYYKSTFELTEEAARIKKKCKTKSKELMKSCYIV